MKRCLRANRLQILGVFAVLLLGVPPLSWAGESWQCALLPSEREIVRDVSSGAELVFVTRSPGTDSNLYFHQRSWLPDGSLMAFHSDREGGQGLYGYLEATGELVRLGRPGQSAFGLPDCSRHRPSIHLLEGRELKEWKIEVTVAPSGQGSSPSSVRVTEQAYFTLPDEGASVAGMSESSDGRAVFVGYNLSDPQVGKILRVDIQSGSSQTILEVPGTIGHIQASWETPDLVMFCKNGPHADRASLLSDETVTHRMWLADSTHSEPRALYPQLEGELVTHECWWTEDRVTFCCGDQHQGDAVESHVKVIDIETGIARIIGAGSWWPGGTPSQVGARNWWHCAGSPDGKWVAADNWHGELGLFSARTSRTRILTTGHRTYGSGSHPHMGWDPTGTKLVFASDRRGNSDVCLATIPPEWLKERW